jgi:hypothetical protein
MPFLSGVHSSYRLYCKLRANTEGTLENYAAAYWGPNVHRLSLLRREWDPDNARCSLSNRKLNSRSLLVLTPAWCVSRGCSPTYRFNLFILFYAKGVCIPIELTMDSVTTLMTSCNAKGVCIPTEHSHGQGTHPSGQKEQPGGGGEQ